MGKWEIVKLDEVCSLITDGTHQTPEYCNANEGYPFLSSKDVTTEVIKWDDIKYIPKPLHEQLYKRLAPQVNDVLLAKNGTTGVAALVDRNCIFDIYVSLALLRPSERIYPPYLLRVINSPLARNQFNAHLKGIGVQNLHLSEIRNTKIPLPPLNVQQKIADVLDKASALIELRRVQLDKLDLLIKSQFVEMFGEPNEFEQCTVDDVCVQILGGGTPSKSKLEYFTGEIPWVTPKDMKTALIADSIDHITEEAIENSATKLIPERSVLMVIRSGILKHDLPIAINTVPVTINQDMKAFVVCDRTTPEFLMYTFDVRKAELLSNVRAVTADNIEFGIIRNLNICLPPLELQNRFADFVRQTDKSKIVLQQSLSKLELNYKSLMQKCFRGEIF